MSPGESWVYLVDLGQWWVHKPGRLFVNASITSNGACTYSVEQALKPVAAWAAGARPDALTRLYPEGRLTYDGANARGWLALLTEWRGMAAGADGESAPLN